VPGKASARQRVIEVENRALRRKFNPIFVEDLAINFK
jgi:hypothetical protein